MEEVKMHISSYLEKTKGLDTCRSLTIFRKKDLR
jgi:hypothetical protein